MRLDPWTAVFTARWRLVGYIDKLWTGRAACSPSLRPVYTERLASAAKLSTMLHGPVAPATLHDLVRGEDRAFPRELLATDAGRQARSAFNIFMRDSAALEGHAKVDGTVPAGPETIVGDPLSSVDFRMDYLMLEFDRQSFRVECPLVVVTASGSLRLGEKGFRDAICDRIGEKVLSAQMTSTALVVGVASARIELFFGSPEATSPEPLTFIDRDHRQCVYWRDY
jgi:hypothetical protein